MISIDPFSGTRVELADKKIDDPVGAISGTLSQAASQRTSAPRSTRLRDGDTSGTVKDNRRMVLAGQAADRECERGYAMAALLVGMSIMAVLMSAALPSWTHLVQREKEEEYLFRAK